MSWALRRHLAILTRSGASATTSHSAQVQTQAWSQLRWCSCSTPQFYSKLYYTFQHCRLSTWVRLLTALPPATFDTARCTTNTQNFDWNNALVMSREVGVSAQRPSRRALLHSCKQLVHIPQKLEWWASVSLTMANWMSLSRLPVMQKLEANVSLNLTCSSESVGPQGKAKPTTHSQGDTLLGGHWLPGQQHLHRHCNLRHWDSWCLISLVSFHLLGLVVSFIVFSTIFTIRCCLSSQSLLIEEQ
jgi:hypothetical protein